MSNSLTAVAKQIEQAQSINIILHQHPDGDAIGSAAALVKAFPKKRITISCATELPEIYTKIVGEINYSKIISKPFDCYLIVDCSEAHRTGFASDLKTIDNQKLCIIDHHKNGNLLRNVGSSFVDSNYCSTTEIIDELLKTMRIKITPKVATPLLLGLYTDTGGFKHSNVTGDVLKRASRLVSYGGDINSITKSFMRKLSPIQRQLWGKVLMETEINRWGIACAKISLKTLRQSQADIEDAFGLANNIALINEAKAAIVFIEQPNGWRGILRTKNPQINIGKLAKLLGGKGQQKAAGFRMTKSALSDIISN